MRYYSFSRRKSGSTTTYGVINVNDPSKLPDKVFEGRWRQGEPWKSVGEFDEDDAPDWFDSESAQKAIDQFGYWLVDMEEGNIKG